MGDKKQTVYMLEGEAKALADRNRTKKFAKGSEKGPEMKGGGVQKNQRSRQVRNIVAQTQK